MGIFSALSKKTEDESGGEFRSRAQEESIDAPVESASRRKSKTKNTREPIDPALPEKKRARRRLIGALAMVLCLVVGLPMIFDAEPHGNLRNIKIDIPSKDSASAVFPANQEKEIQVPELDSSVTSTTPTTAPATKDVNSASQTTATALSNKSATALDEKEVIVTPTPAVTQKVDTHKIQEAKIQEAKPHATVNELKTTESKVDAKLLAKEKEHKVEEKAKTEVKVENTRVETKKQDDATRAMAILEGKVPEEAKKTSTKIVYQVAALSSASKINELQKQIKAANINTMTQTVDTPKGEVIRLRVGPFATKEEADKARAKLIKLGFSVNAISN
jgi:DedD protein